MRVLTGVDIESTARFKALFEKKKSVLRKNYSQQEWEYAEGNDKPWQSLAGIWCAKEAAVKCLNNLGSGFMFSDFNISHDNRGAPKVELHQLEITSILINISVSISHNKEQTVAVVTALVD